MKNIFFKLYQQLLISIFLVGILAYASTWVTNQWRLSLYFEDLSEGTFSLIAKGLSRHTGEEQGQWLSAISRIIDLKLTVKTEINTKKDFYIKSSIFNQNFQANHRIGNSNSFVAADITEINEDIAYASATLILNELGLTPKHERLEKLKFINDIFSYPITKIKKSALALTPAQQRRLQRGDIFTKLDNQKAQARNMTLFAPYGKTDYALVLGPIPLFTWYSQEIVFGALSILLIFIGVIGVAIVKPLEKRFAQLMNSVDQVGLDQTPFYISLSGNDNLNTLSNRINKMSERISTLLNHQSELMHAISHDLKTPLSRLRFRISLLEAAKNNEERLSRMSSMYKDIEELNALIDEILELAKIQSKGNILNITNINTEEFIQALKHTVGLVSEGKVIAFAHSIDTFQADEYYLKRAISNLITNAIRYSNKKITIGFDTKGSKTRIIVEDDGQGIDRKDRLKVFEPFSTVDLSRNKQSSGFGLGLTIVKRIIDWHHGEVVIEESNLGGSKFIIIIPSQRT